MTYNVFGGTLSLTQSIKPKDPRQADEHPAYLSKEHNT